MNVEVMYMARILIVEDDNELGELFQTVLNEFHYDVTLVFNGKEALNVMETQDFDLLITDIMMPIMDGYELVELIRSVGYNMPILMISAKDQIVDKGKGFSLGIDDYVVKPVDIEEFKWRVQALLKRYKIQTDRKLELGGIVIDQDLHAIIKDENQQILPAKEFQLLFKLASNPNKIFTRMQIMDEIWGLDASDDMHTLDVHISRLRERLKEFDPLKIVTVRGLGYRLTYEETAY